MKNIIAVMTLLVLSVFSTGAEAASRLYANQGLNPGDYLTSDNGAYELVLQPGDGNLVLYRISDMKPLWATYTQGGALAVMQQDRNFVVYNQNGTSSYNALWASNTGGSVVDLNVYLTVTNDGYAKIINSAGQTIWSVGGVSAPPPPSCIQSMYAVCYNIGSPAQFTGYIWACDYNDAWMKANMSGATLGSCPYMP
jgi:hypothetical protein